MNKAFKVTYNRLVSFQKDIEVSASSPEEAMKVAITLGGEEPLNTLECVGDSEQCFSVEEIECVKHFETDDNYWDCACDTDYVHPKSQESCHWCKVTLDDDPPDSRKNEIALMWLRKKGE